MRVTHINTVTYGLNSPEIGNRPNAPKTPSNGLKHAKKRPKHAFLPPFSTRKNPIINKVASGH